MWQEPGPPQRGVVAEGTGTLLLLAHPSPTQGVYKEDTLLHFFVCFGFFGETGSCYVALVVLELAT